MCLLKINNKLKEIYLHNNKINQNIQFNNKNKSNQNSINVFSKQ